MASHPAHALISGFWANIKNGPKQDPTPKPKGK